MNLASCLAVFWQHVFVSWFSQQSLNCLTNKCWHYSVGSCWCLLGVIWAVQRASDGCRMTKGPFHCHTAKWRSKHHHNCQDGAIKWVQNENRANPLPHSQTRVRRAPWCQERTKRWIQNEERAMPLSSAHTALCSVNNCCLFYIEIRSIFLFFLEVKHTLANLPYQIKLKMQREGAWGLSVGKYLWQCIILFCLLWLAKRV